MPGAFDDGLVLVFGVLAPALGIIRARSLVRAVEHGRGSARRRAYLETIIMQWTMLAMVVCVWAWYDRPWVALGIGPAAGIAFWVTAGLVLVGAGFFAVELTRVRRDETARREVRAQVARIVAILPRTASERSVFLALGLTAGVCEELFYRGYMLWWGEAIGLPIWATVALAAALFSFGHLYQGFDNAMRIFSLGVVFGAIAWLTGSIWIPIAAHALIDVASGLTAYEALRDRSAQAARAPVV